MIASGREQNNTCSDDDGCSLASIATRSNSPDSPRDPERRRALLADAALDVLGTEGARALTHRRVDRAAGVPDGSTSNVFRSREDLLLGALDRLIEIEIGAALVAPTPAATDPAGDGAELLAALITMWAAPEHRPRLSARFELLIEATRRPNFQPPLLERRHEIITAVEQLLTAAGRDAPRLRATSLVAWVDGLLLHHLLDPELVADEERLRALIALQLS